MYLAAVGIPLGMVTSLTMALLLNTKLRGQQWYRTFFYMPSIVPVVATSVLWSFILNSDANRGLVNAAWQATISHWFGLPPPGWLSVPAWAKPGLIFMGLWGAGGGMILWLAGLQSISPTLYEAASLDGAGWWSQFRHVTLPMLSPYIFFNLIMGTIGALQTFETAYILGGTGGGSSTGPDDSLLVPVVYLFNNAFQYFKMGYASLFGLAAVHPDPGADIGPAQARPALGALRDGGQIGCRTARFSGSSPSCSAMPP